MQITFVNSCSLLYLQAIAIGWPHGNKNKRTSFNSAGLKDRERIRYLLAHACGEQEIHDDAEAPPPPYLVRFDSCLRGTDVPLYLVSASPFVLRTYERGRGRSAIVYVRVTPYRTHRAHRLRVRRVASRQIAGGSHVLRLATKGVGLLDASICVTISGVETLCVYRYSPRVIFLAIIHSAHVRRVRQTTTFDLT